MLFAVAILQEFIEPGISEKECFIANKLGIYLPGKSLNNKKWSLSQWRIMC